jgi:class 3 adenylate cyclase
MSEATTFSATAPSMAARSWSRLAIGGWLAATALVAAGVAMLITTRDVALPPAWGFRGFPIFFAVTYSFVGWLIASRRPENRIAWLLLATGLGGAILFFTVEYATFGAVAYPGSLPGPQYVAWVGSWIWVPFSFGAAPLFFLLFPDGHLKSARWKPVLWLSAGVMTVNAVLLALVPGPLTNFGYADNPFGVPAVGSLVGLGQALVVLFGFTFLGAAVSLALRLREAKGEERQQIKWVAYAAVIASVSALAADVFGKPFDALFIVAVSSLPIAAGIAVLRYRLYDVDLLINRTVVYGAVTAVLAVAFWVADVILQQVFQSATGQRSDLLTGALGVGVGLLFAPLRRRVKPVVDRFLPSRAMLALLFTDIVGSTEAIVRMGDERWRGVLGRYLSVVRQELARSGGHEVNTAGDAFFATFERPAAALEAAWSMRAAVRRLGLETRTGIHVGEVEMRGEQVSGLAVHTAARVMSAADPGEVLVSDAFRAAIQASDVSLADRGRHQLKGVPGDRQLYSAELAAARE